MMFGTQQSHDYHVYLPLLAGTSLYRALSSGKECHTSLSTKLAPDWTEGVGAISDSTPELASHLLYYGHYKNSAWFSFSIASIHQLLLLPPLCSSHAKVNQHLADTYVILGGILCNLVYYWPYLLNGKGSKLYLYIGKELELLNEEEYLLNLHADYSP